MRNVVNISLPEEMTREIKREVKIGGFASTSEFFRHLLRQRKAEKLARELKKDRAEFERGKGKVLKSLKDLR